MTASPPPPRRADGRGDDALRPVRFLWDSMGFALASLTVEAGRTRVLCSVCLEEEVPRWRRGGGRGWLSAEYRLLPASTPDRQPRELMKLSGRAEVDLNVVGDEADQLLEIQGTAEGAPFSRDQLTAMLDLAAQGLAGLREAQNAALAEQAAKPRSGQTV